MRLAILFALLVSLIGIVRADEPETLPPPSVTFLYFGSPTCQPCQRMKKETLADKDVKAALKDKCGPYVTIIDIEQSGVLARDYKVNVVPTYLVLVNGDVLRRATGYKSPADLLKWLK